MLDMTMTARAIAAATIDDARAYLAETDRFVWCEAWLWSGNDEMPRTMARRGKWIEKLERQFDLLILAAGTAPRPIRGFYIRTGGKPELLCGACWGGDADHVDVVGVERIGSRECFMCNQTLTEGNKQC